jgi:hypothetical protein
MSSRKLTGRSRKETLETQRAQRSRRLFMPEPASDNSSLSEKVIGLAIDVDRHLGPGLLESVYEKCAEGGNQAFRRLRRRSVISVPSVLKKFSCSSQLALEEWSWM